MACRITLALSPETIFIIESEIDRYRDIFSGDNINPLYVKDVWIVIGNKTGLDPFATCLCYLRYLERRRGD